MNPLLNDQSEAKSLFGDDKMINYNISKCEWGFASDHNSVHQKKSVCILNQ